MENLIADLRHAVRLFWKSPGFIAVAVAALALGIGANTAIFSVINVVLLKPLPYAEPDRLMQLGRSYPEGVGDSTSVPKFNVWKKSDVFEAMSAYDFAGPGMNIGGGDRPEQVKGIHVSGEYFRVFGVAPALGRTFTGQEDLPGGPKVAVLNYTLWKDRFGADPGLVGRSIAISGEPTIVVGIMPASFSSDPPADIFVPLQADPNSTNQGHYLRVAGRLKPGVSVPAAKAQMKIGGERFRQANPKWMDKTESVGWFRCRKQKSATSARRCSSFWVPLVSVLLIACANVANLQLRPRLYEAPGDRHSHFHRRRSWTHCAPVADGECRVGRGGRGMRLHPGSVGRSAVACHCSRQPPAHQ